MNVIPLGPFLKNAKPTAVEVRKHINDDFTRLIAETNDGKVDGVAIIVLKREGPHEIGSYKLPGTDPVDLLTLMQVLYEHVSVSVYE